MGQNSFILHSNYTPSGDQPEAIAKLIAGVNNGATHQTLKGVTGSGKTFTMANVIHRLNELQYTQLINKGKKKAKLKRSHEETINQIIRPTGLLDPEVEVRPSENRMDDLLAEIHQRIAQDERVLVMTITKKSAEALTDFMSQKGIRVRYLHSDIKTSKRTEIIDALRAGEFDVLIGINLLREGLDIPEASLVAILDADRAGFLRSVQALIQIIGRVARNTNGKAILYADKITNAMRQAIDESDQRRVKQIAYNKIIGITPTSSKRKQTSDSEDTTTPVVHDALFCKNLPTLCRLIGEREKALLKFTNKNELENIARVRDELDKLYSQFIFMQG